MINYLPFNERQPNTVYRDSLQFLEDLGFVSESAHEAKSWMYFSPPKLRFNLAIDGFPLITERSFKGIYRSSIGEGLAFINGVRNLEGLDTFGVSRRFWEPWVTPEKCAKRGLASGDLGDGSYGPVFHDLPMPAEFTKDDMAKIERILRANPNDPTYAAQLINKLAKRTFNQVATIVQQLKERPFDRSHRICNWYLPYLVRIKGARQRTVVTPCWGDMYFRVYNNKLNLHMTQHKADIITGLPNNIAFSAAFLMIMAHVTDWEAGELVIDPVDAHYYLMEPSQGTITPKEAITIMRSREPLPFPTMHLAENTPKDIFAIRPEHFILEDYYPHDAIKGITTGI